MSKITREKIEAWRDLGAAYVEHMPDGDAMFTALCDMALESIALKLDAERYRWLLGYLLDHGSFPTYPMIGLSMDMHQVDSLIDGFIKEMNTAPRERLIRIMGTFDLATGHADSWDDLLDSLESELRDVLGHYRERKKWVGLTDDEKRAIGTVIWESEFATIEAKLKEKNSGHI